MAGNANGNLNTVVNQTSQNVILNWNSFNIKAGESVLFQQPNSSSIVLNRVLRSDPSQIFGQLQANGQVFLLNPNGILFARGAQVNVGALVASIMNLSDADFAARRFNFVGGNGGRVQNDGSLTARDGGYISLLGQQVQNNGVITAKLGKVVQAGGQAVTLDVVGDGLVSAVVDQASVKALVDNAGRIAADGGLVETSGKQVLQALGTMDASACAGEGMHGVWLLDPNNITIDAVGVNTNISQTVGSFTSTDDSAVLSNTSLGLALTASSSAAMSVAMARSSCWRMAPRPI